MKNLKFYSPFLWMWFNCLKVTEPLRGDSLLFTTQSPGFPSTHLIDLRRMKDEFTLEPPSNLGRGTTGLGIQHPNYYDNW